jgi:hypothetical protein
MKSIAKYSRDYEIELWFEINAIYLNFFLSDLIMAFRSNDGYNLSLKGNSVQPSGNLSTRPSSARNNSQSKQPTTPSKGGNLKYINVCNNYVFHC